MKKSRFTEEQILFALKQGDAGQPVADVCRQMGISEATYYNWKKRYGNLGLLEVRELRQLRDENARLKRLVADLTLDRHVLQEVIKKKGSSPNSGEGGADLEEEVGIIAEAVGNALDDLDLVVDALDQFRRPPLLSSRSV